MESGKSEKVGKCKKVEKKKKVKNGKRFDKIKCWRKEVKLGNWDIVWSKVGVVSKTQIMEVLKM